MRRIKFNIHDRTPSKINNYLPHSRHSLCESCVEGGRFRRLVISIVGWRGLGGTWKRYKLTVIIFDPTRGYSHPLNAKRMFFQPVISLTCSCCRTMRYGWRIVIYKLIHKNKDNTELQRADSGTKYTGYFSTRGSIFPHDAQNRFLSFPSF